MIDPKKVSAGLKYLERQFGKTAIMGLHDAVAQTPSISTGHPLIDSITGIGGFPRGKIVEIFGWESSGKSTLSLQVMASEQKAGGSVLYVDAEHSFSPAYAKRLGVDLGKNRFLVTQPSCAEEALDITCAAIDLGMVSMVVIDSTAALTPRSELEGILDKEGDGKEGGGGGIGEQARIMSRALRHIMSKGADNDVCTIFINQIRANIKIGGYGKGGNEKTTGGNALKFYASLRIELKKIGNIKGKLLDPVMKKTYEGIVGHKVSVQAVKNKCAPPFRKTEVTLQEGRGFDVEGSIIDIAVAQKVVDQTGAWYSYNGERLGQGIMSAKTFFREHPDILAEVVKRLDLGGGDDIPEVVSMDEPLVDGGEPVDVDQLLGVAPSSTEQEGS